MELLSITAGADQVQAISLLISFILTGVFYKRYKTLKNQIKNEELLEQFLK